MPIPLDARHIASQGGAYAPQLGNNFMIEIAGLAGDAKDLILLSLASTSIPDEESDSIPLHYGNETRYVAGKPTYTAIPMAIHDYVDREVRKSLIEWRRQVYDPATGLIGLPGVYKKEASLILVASDNTHYRVCRLIGVWPQKVIGGKLDMGKAEPVMIDVTLQYDRHIWAF